MEALDFLQCYYAMCYHRHSPNGCGDCKAQEIDCELTTDYPEKLVEAVERWAKAHPEEAADATKPKQDETCGIKPEDFVNHFITEMLMRHEEQIEKLTQNVEELMKPVNAAEEPTAKPKRTNKDVLVAAFPNTRMDDNGIPDICPRALDTQYDCKAFASCSRCKRTHWPAEVEE